MRNFNYKNDISIVKDVEVLVVGGGPAGIAAAVSSSRLGAKTLLVEANGYLGGMATAGLVGPFMTSFSPDGERQVIKGIYEELIRCLEEKGKAIHPSQILGNSSYSSYIKRGHDHVAPFDSESLKLVAEEMCINSGVELLYHNFFVDAIVDETTNAIKGGIFASKSGLVAIMSKVIIDCTGDGDVAYASGAETKMGRDQDGLTQPTTLFFQVRNVDRAKIEEYRDNNPEPDGLQFSKLVEKARKNGDFPIQREKLGVYESVTPGHFRVNTTRIPNVDATNPVEVTRATIEGRKQVQIVLNFMKKYVPGFEEVELVDTAPQLGVRESRRIVGEYVLTQEDLMESRVFEDTIALGGFAIDIHQPDGSSGAFLLIETGKAYSIPYRSLIPKSIGNLLVAGRCISATHEALGAVRVMPSCFATGEAAGAAAALSIKNNVDVREVDVRLLRETLVKQGAVVE
jgi:hypothetical protein